jgi:ABC-type antimicrobial peptide transport system permease subunit
VGQMVVREAMALVTAGLGIGTCLAIVVGRMIAGLVVGVQPGKPIAFLIATAVLGLSGFVAAAIPAYVASRIDPVRALRSD